MAAKKPDISTRRELFDYLEEQMNRSYRQVLTTGRLESESTYVKTLLLESDWRPSGSITEETNELQVILTIPSQDGSRADVVPTVSRTSEIGFYYITWPSLENPVQTYIDTGSDLLRRFWIAYSLSDAVDVDHVFDRLSLSRTSLDRVWLWPDLLESAQKRGEFRGVGVDYDYRRFDLQPDSTAYFKMQLWSGPAARRLLESLQLNSDFARQMVLAKVRMKYLDDPEDASRFAIEDIKYNGKFTTRGTSFDTHQALVAAIRNSYSDSIQHIERTYTIQEDCDARLQGDPLFFIMEDPIQDLDQFCSIVFSGHLPFRLWGVPRQTPEQGGRYVAAVDLHTGSKLFFEVFPDIISMYLYEGTCGNTVARFYTNLQHTVSRMIKAEDNEQRPIFQSLDD